MLNQTGYTNKGFRLKGDKSDTIKRGRTTQEQRKRAFLSELLNPSCLGNITVAARRTGIARQMLYRWRKADKNFASVWEENKNEANELLVEKAESALIGAIEAGNATAIIFTLKSLRPQRWGDKKVAKFK